EAHQHRRARRCELSNAAFGRVKPELERFERQAPALDNDQLAVEREPVLRKGEENHCDIREIAGERPSRLGPERDVAAVANGDAAEAVPLGLILPASALR